jgi:Uma2 family endonuclease
METQSASVTGCSSRGRKPLALVIDPGPEEASAPIDWSAWYLTDEEDMGEGADQSDILAILLSSLGELAFERGWQNVYWSGDNFFAWVPSEPLVRVSPDAYLMDDAPPPPRPKSWQTWLPGHKAPRWAVEVVSEAWRKDYDDNPPKYAQLGVKELVIFDPEARESARQQKERVPLQLYRRGDDGAFVRAYRGDGPVFCEQIGAWLVIVPDGAAARLRIARDAAGKDIVPTAAERARAEEKARRAEEKARLAAEERAAEAENRVRELELELAKRRGA